MEDKFVVLVRAGDGRGGAARRRPRRLRRSEHLRPRSVAPLAARSVPAPATRAAAPPPTVRTSRGARVGAGRPRARHCAHPTPGARVAARRRPVCRTVTSRY